MTITVMFFYRETLLILQRVRIYAADESEEVQAESFNVENITITPGTIFGLEYFLLTKPVFGLNSVVVSAT